MEEPSDFIYQADTTEELSTEVVSAIAQAHEEDVIAQKWTIADDINTDALDELFKGHKRGISLQFNADEAKVTITADKSGNPVIKIESHR